jgi:hypothetical protein
MRALIRATALSALLAVVPLSGVAAGSTSSDYGIDVTCRYRSVPVTGWDWKMNLRRIRVDPPTVLADGPEQLVGWRFIVQKRNDNIDWRRIYRSPIQKATALDYLPADFTKMTLDIAKPKAASTHYRVVVKIFRYGWDGRIVARDKVLVNEYRVLRDGQPMWIDKGSCAFSWLSNQ